MSGEQTLGHGGLSGSANGTAMAWRPMALTRVPKAAQALPSPPGVFLMSALGKGFPVTERKSRVIHTRCRGSRPTSMQRCPQTTRMNHKDRQDFFSLQNRRK